MARIAAGQSLGAREQQEDAYQVVRQSEDTDDTELLLIIADGMGGHAGGEVASRLAIEAFIDHFQNVSENMRPTGRLEEAAVAANAAVSAEVSRNPAYDGMGCTLLAVLAVQDRVIWCSIGDSILFHLRNGQIRRLNADHSYFGALLEMVERKEMTLADAKAHPRKNALRSAITGKPLSLIDTNNVRSEEGDIIILATDGLETLSDDEIMQITYQHSKAGAADIKAALLEKVAEKQRPKQDNTTIIVFQESGTTKTSPLGDRKWELSQRTTSRIMPLAVLGAGVLALLLLGTFMGLFSSTPEPEVVAPPTVDVPRPLQDAGSIITDGDFPETGEEVDPPAAEDPPAEVEETTPQEAEDTAPDDVEPPEADGPVDTDAELTPEEDPNPRPVARPVDSVD